MGPKRFGKQGKLAFSFGNVAQDEGSAMAQYAWSRGWKTAGLATNTLLVYFKNVVQAFEKRFKQLGGKIVDSESYATGQNNVNAAVAQLNSHKAAVYVTSTSFGELPAFVSGFRSLHNSTPILNSWAGDGTYWLPKSPKVTNYYCVTYASVFGDDPSKDVRSLIGQMKNAGSPPGTGGFLGGADTIDGLAIAIKRAHGSTNGAALAAQLVKFKDVKVLGGPIRFSSKFHTVFGRTYRVIKIQNNKAKFVGTIKAKVVPNL
jgi:branched-chain amino acid transport system substrate-binding protein